MSTLEPAGLALLALLLMAAATFLTRASGFWMMAHVPLTPRVRRMLEALPGSIVAAIVLPIIARAGPPAMLGIAAAVAIMVLRRNEFLAVAAGVSVAALVRGAALAGF
jgi:uncharacterized membrane protein